MVCWHFASERRWAWLNLPKFARPLWFFFVMRLFGTSINDWEENKRKWCPFLYFSLLLLQRKMKPIYRCRSRWENLYRGQYRFQPIKFVNSVVPSPCETQPYNKAAYCMASSVSGQDESNPALWLAAWAGKMELSCPLGTTRRVPQEKFPRKPYNKSFTDQACSAKMAGYWPRSFFASLWTSTPSCSINTQNKNSANIQPSWPHTWSITHI